MPLSAKRERRIPGFRPAARRSLAQISALLTLLLMAACSSSPSAPETRSVQRHNILLVTIDTLRADYLGSYGGPAVTPHLDGLAARGVRFDQVFAQVPLTTPSHASILTGAQPPAHKIHDVGGFVLDRNVATLAETLHKEGYRTGAFVSAAVLDRHYGLDRGFQVYRDDMGAEQPSEKLPGVVAEIRGDAVTERALDWLQDSASGASEPFLLWVHYYDPHFPYDPPQPYRETYAQDAYAGEVAFTDEQVGRLLTRLADSGQEERTLVAVLSDHGESLGEHGEETHGVFLYDSTMRIPLIMAGPEIRRGHVVDDQVQSVDLVPTLLDCLGLPSLPTASGVSLRPALSEGRRVRSGYAYMESVYPKTHMGWSELRAVRSRDWKYVSAPRPELYHLSADPAESENVVHRFPAEAERLRNQIWDVAGPPESWNVQAPPVDEETFQRLKALGYVSAGSRRIDAPDATGPDPKDRVPVLQAMDRATSLMNSDRFAEAVPVLRQAVQSDPANPLLYQHLGLCFQEQRQFRKALEVYQEAQRNGADTDRTHAEIGEIQVRLGDLESAVAAFEQSARINPTNTDALNNLANAYLQMNRLDDAARTAQAVLVQNERNAAAHNLMGLVSLARGQASHATRYFQQAITHNPKLAEPYMNLGLLSYQSGDTQSALRYYKAFLEHATGPQYEAILPRVKAAIADLEKGS